MCKYCDKTNLAKCRSALDTLFSIKPYMSPTYRATLSFDERLERDCQEFRATKVLKEYTALIVNNTIILADGSISNFEYPGTVYLNTKFKYCPVCGEELQ